MKWQVASGSSVLHRFDLAQAGGVEMADAGIPQLHERDGMRIGLQAYSTSPGKPVEELLGGGGEGVAGCTRYSGSVGFRLSIALSE